MAERRLQQIETRTGNEDETEVVFTGGVKAESGVLESARKAIAEHINVTEVIIENYRERDKENGIKFTHYITLLAQPKIGEAEVSQVFTAALKDLRALEEERGKKNKKEETFEEKLHTANAIRYCESRLLSALHNPNLPSALFNAYVKPETTLIGGYSIPSHHYRNTKISAELCEQYAQTLLKTESWKAIQNIMENLNGTIKLYTDVINVTSRHLGEKNPKDIIYSLRQEAQKKLQNKQLT